LLFYEWARSYQLITHHKDICDNAINSQFGRRLFPEDLGQLLDRHQLCEVLLGDIRPGGGPGHRALGLLHLQVVVAAAHVRAPVVGVVGGVAGLVLLPVQLPALQGRLTGVRLALGTRVAHFAEDLADPTSTQLVLGQWKRTTKGHKKGQTQVCTGNGNGGNQFDSQGATGAGTGSFWPEKQLRRVAKPVMKHTNTALTNQVNIFT